jgi:dihydropteroate synthase
MGVLNVTPDSFSDGGRFLDADAAIAHGRAMVAAGADVVDVGGESTRPGADPVDLATELDRVLPVVEALRGEARISIDTRKAEVAEAAVAAGASLVNDVSASLGEVAAATGAGWVAMHMQGEPGSMQAAPEYDDVVAEVRDLLVQRAEAARAAGVTEVWIDPGIGFGKTLAHNLALLAHLDELVATGFPVAVGVSRKSSLGTLIARSDGQGGHPDRLEDDERAASAASRSAAPVEDRLEASVALAAWSVAAGAGMVRVHDVAETVRALAVVAQAELAVAA